MVESIKALLAKILDLLGILNHKMNSILQKKNAIRAVNYHRTPAEEISTFQQQLEYYSKHYQNVNKENFDGFLNGQYVPSKQGIVLTFDDGLMNNYTEALPLLEKYGFIGWFFVSTGLIGKPGYMGKEELLDLLKRGHVVGCHTYSHHRMNEEDTNDIYQHEIQDAQLQLSKDCNSPIDVFCWCGGEEDTYTKGAEEWIRKSFRYSFMTNSDLIVPTTDPYHLQRTNVEARWSLSLLKFQLCGIVDKMYAKKRNRVNQVTQ